MKRMSLLVLLASLAMLVCPLVRALDRDRPLIDSIEATYREYDQFDAVGVLVRGQTQVPIGTDLGLVVNLGWASADTEAGAKDLFNASIGLRQDLTSLSAFTVAADFEWVDDASDLGVVGARTQLDMRLTPAESPCSPFLGVGASYTAGRSTPWDFPRDDFSAVLISVIAGLDLAISTDVSLTARGVINEALSLDGGSAAKYANGWAASLGLKYYWPSTD